METRAAGDVLSKAAPVMLVAKLVSMKDIELHSTITCPLCGHRQAETMPTDACQFFYDCKGCGAVLRPLAGDCCIYCSYGTVKCPPVQAGTCC